MIKQHESDTSFYYEHQDILYNESEKISASVNNIIKQMISNKDELSNKINMLKLENENFQKKLDIILNQLQNFSNLPWYKKLFFKFKINI